MYSIYSWITDKNFKVKVGFMIVDAIFFAISVKLEVLCHADVTGGYHYHGYNEKWKEKKILWA